MFLNFSYSLLKKKNNKYKENKSTFKSNSIIFFKILKG